MTEQLSPLALQALAVVKESGAIIGANHAHPHTIRHKGRIDLVTETDIAVEAFLKALQPWRPRPDSSLKRARKI